MLLSAVDQRRSIIVRDRQNFGFGFGAECGQMGTFGEHSGLAESSQLPLSISAGWVNSHRHRLYPTDAYRSPRRSKSTKRLNVDLEPGIGGPPAGRRNRNKE